MHLTANLRYIIAQFNKPVVARRAGNCSELTEIFNVLYSLLMNSDASSELQQYIEEYGMFAAATGLPRMAGKILGWLMVCNPPYQTAEEIEMALGASKGTVSTMTRLLMQIGFIEKVGIPGQRRAHYRLKVDAWTQVITNEFSMMRSLRNLAERGLALLAGTPPENQQRLQDMQEVMAFIEREIPGLLERFQRERMQNRLGAKL